MYVLVPLLSLSSLTLCPQSYKSISPMTRPPLEDGAGRGPRDRQNGMENEKRWDLGAVWLWLVLRGRRVGWVAMSRCTIFFNPIFCFYRIIPAGSLVGPQRPCLSAL
ncbi:hypothetical protein DFH06DRAFT_1193707 [Mycena polygramma]|nr:hypothetical protein DFH06DRAFT_1193707 [Mycena polygramma]